MNINLYTAINTLGYGVVGLNVLKELIKKNNQVALFPIYQPELTREKDVEVFKEGCKNAESFDLYAPSIKIWHQFQMAESIGKGERIGFPIFELDKFTNVEKHHLSSLDKILVCSQWAKQVVENNITTSKIPTYVVPLGVDRSIFNENVDDVRANHIDTLFLHVGKWEIRKGIDFILECFNKAFEKEDSVRLLLLCHNPFIQEKGNEDWANSFKQSKLGDKIEIIPRLPTHDVVATLMKSVDCGLFPARAEGWNLELLEMMSMGKHVITTYYSGHTEFIDDINSHIININELELAYDGLWFHGQGSWAKLGNEQIGSMVSHMRNIHRLKQNNKLKTNVAGIETAKKFTWENTAEKLLEAIQ